MSKKRKNKTIISEEEKQKRAHVKDIRTTMSNIGFIRIPNIEGQHFCYQNCQTELDDIFVYDNLVLLVEYTTQKDVSSHMKGKKVFYDLVNNSYRNFIEFALKEEKLQSFKLFYDQKIRQQYSINELKIRILYCSLKVVDSQHKAIMEENGSVKIYNYDTAQYFKQLVSNIKKSACYEFFDFLGLRASEIGSRNDLPDARKFKGNILPVERSSFKLGYNVVSFYIDAESLIRRAYVLRQECWRGENASGFYQRMVKGKKISSMRKYLANEGRVFINNVIATLSNEHARLLDAGGKPISIDAKGNFEGNDTYTVVTPAQVEIDDLPNIIGIIDGQHRVYAYHEGNDVYEEKIANLRTKQHLLVTAVLFPIQEPIEVRRRFEATLFLEINNNQTNVSSALRQEIDLMISPFSVTAVCKRIVSKLNQSGPLCDQIELHSYEKGKLKTASIVSYGLIPLVKFDDSDTSDSLFKIWNNSDKQELKKESNNIELLNLYVDFCVESIRNILIATKRVVDSDLWHPYDPKEKKGFLSVTNLNGILNVLRCQIKFNGKLLSSDEYYEKMREMKLDEFKTFKSSQYNKMGKYLFEKYFVE
ncbi:MAG: DGQHR domain-containing protein [Prevotella sp.]|nr:DGQHR domain-containing protein [Prevotella sp.]